MGFSEQVQQAGGKGIGAPRLGIRRGAAACTKSVSVPELAARHEKLPSTESAVGPTLGEFRAGEFSRWPARGVLTV